MCTCIIKVVLCDAKFNFSETMPDKSRPSAFTDSMYQRRSTVNGNIDRKTNSDSCCRDILGDIKIHGFCCWIQMSLLQETRFSSMAQKQYGIHFFHFIMAPYDRFCVNTRLTCIVNQMSLRVAIIYAHCIMYSCIMLNLVYTVAPFYWIDFDKYISNNCSEH